MTAQSLLVVLREKELRLRGEFKDVSEMTSSTSWIIAIESELQDTETAIRVIEEVLRSTRETRKEFGDPTLEAATGSGGDLGLGSSTPR